MAGEEELMNPRLDSHKAFTLIELLISITITTFLVVTVYLTLKTSLDTWMFARYELSLQKVLSSTMDQIINGTPTQDGLKDALEVIQAESGDVEFLSPWMDDSHSVANVGFAYRLQRKMKAGAVAPIGEVKLPESDDFILVPVRAVQLEDTESSYVRIMGAPPEGSDLRFVYHVDADGNEDLIRRVWYDSESEQIISAGEDGRSVLSKNAYGVRITNFVMTFLDNKNRVVGEYGDVSEDEIQMVTGVEVLLEAEVDGYEQELLSFINLRNVPMSSGYALLREGTQLIIPDSQEIHTLILTNISGVDGDDKIRLEFEDQEGSTMGAELKFSKIGSLKTKLESFIIEYPVGNVVYSEFPKSSLETGFNFLIIDSEGRYDYYDDPEINDIVNLKGEVTVKVKKMDVAGAALMIRP